MSQITWGSNKDEARQECLLHEALTETTTVQLIMSLYPLPIFIMHPQDIDYNRYKLNEVYNNVIIPESFILLYVICDCDCDMCDQIITVTWNVTL